MPFLAALPAVAAIGAAAGTAGATVGGMSVATASLLGASTALTAGSSILSGYQQSEADKARAIQYKQQAQLDQYNAGREVQDTEAKAVKTIGASSAAAGGAGITQAGSPILAMRESINQANAADVYSRYNGKLRSVSDLYQSDLEKNAANASLFGGFMGAGTSAVKGLFDAFNA